MINKVTYKDKNEYYRLGVLLNSKFKDLFNLDNLLDSSYDYIYGYYVDSLLVGFIHVNKLYEQMDIVNIVVDSNYRCQGIGSQLILYVIKEFSDVSSIMLEVNENNDKAINFYHNLNFKDINIREKYYGLDNAIIMKRDV